MIRRNDAEELVLNLSGAADALKQRHGHDQGVSKNAILGEFELCLGDISWNVKGCDIRVAIGCRCADRCQAVGGECCGSNTGLVGDLNLAEEHRGDVHFGVEKSVEIAAVRVRKNLFKTVFDRVERVARETAACAGISSTSGDLENVVVEGFGVAEVQLQICAGANV